MHHIQVLSLAAALTLLAGVSSPSAARPANLVAPATASNRIEARSTCHHYRWSSRRHCTSANVLRFSARPPLHYPQRYYGGTRHYEYELPYFGYRAPYFSRYGFYRYPWWRRPYWY
jgi:hypothetical protein